MCTQVSVFAETQQRPGTDRGIGEAAADADEAGPRPGDRLLLPLLHQVSPPAARHATPLPLRSFIGALFRSFMYV
jgi:hypothetical protein